MLGRRNLRIKVMQALYAWEMDRETPIIKLEGLLKTQIQRSVNLYITNLAILVELCKYSMVDKAKRLAKFIKTKEDEEASTTIAGNRIVQYLENNEQYRTHIKKEGITNYVTDDVLKTLFNELATKAQYKQYAALQQPTAEQDKEIINYIVKKVIPADKSLEHHLEELFINYDDDNGLILYIISKYVDGFDDTKPTFFQSMTAWEEEKKFAFDLLAKTIDHTDELSTYIEPNLKNWEMDRVAILDLILMKMAVCELKYFPTIPVKVSINEYIDVSKLYSTPKSKDFVNGVLDKIKNQMQQNGEIKKFGRGLME